MAGESQERRAKRDRTDLARRAWRAVMETSGVVAELLEQDLQERSGMDLQTYDALLHVFETRPKGIRMTDLAHKVVISKAGLTSLVDRLEKRGLLARVPDPADRRATRIVVTDLGERRFREAAKVHVEGIEDRFARHLSAEEARVIGDALERIRLGHIAEREGASA